jgi:hypothetical protein
VTNVVREPPQKLKQLIAVVNSIPVTADVKPWDAIKASSDPTLHDLAELKRLGLETYKQHYPKIPRSTLRALRVLTNVNAPGSLVEFHKVYEFLHMAREALRTVARMNRGGPALEILGFSPPLSVPTTLGTDAKGRIVITSDGPILEALQGVELARIRECPECGKIFWAGRVDKPYCLASPCGQVYRKRKSRENSWRYKLTRP